MEQSFTDWVEHHLAPHTGPIQDAILEATPNCGYEKKQCFERLMLMLDGEATELEKDVFMSNISRCMPCYERLKLEHSVKHALSTKIVPMASSARLIADIRAQIAALD